MNIKVKRYSKDMPVWYGTVSPEDGSWVLFIPHEGVPHLYMRVEQATEDGVENTRYVDVRSPEARIGTVAAGAAAGHVLFSISKQEERFFAQATVRSIGGEGATEEEATAQLLKYVAELLDKGALKVEELL